MAPLHPSSFSLTRNPKQAPTRVETLYPNRNLVTLINHSAAPSTASKRVSRICSSSKVNRATGERPWPVGLDALHSLQPITITGLPFVRLWIHPATNVMDEKMITSISFCPEYKHNTVLGGPQQREALSNLSTFVRQQTETICR